MRVKRYIVDSMPDALHKIRTDLGKDAVILSTKEVKTGGFLGLFGKKRIEVIAALEEGQTGSGKNGPEGGAQARPSSKAAAAAAVTAVAKARQEEAEKSADQPRINKEQELRQREFAELLLRQSALQNEEVPTYGTGAAEALTERETSLLKKEETLDVKSGSETSAASADGQSSSAGKGAGSDQRLAPGQQSPQPSPANRPSGNPAAEEALPVIPQRPPA
ncbi:flagellar biosynthesis protein FlhF, partial [Paenibacillus chitinolyticus]|nr:flagellar biosynthesis protein FlhF [Paenibacillus chitinolyticus]